MADNIDIYKEKAEEAIKEVYYSEYHNSLGIPMPEVKMLLPDDVNYNSGEYYIQIGKTWQIHLNFGRLPKSLKEFQEEVKVLTRHEIEHYMCCPYDVISYLRMVNIIIDIYKNKYSNLTLNPQKLASSLTNAIGDIIVDTRNFYRHPNETLNSEINWIKKGAEIQQCPRHDRLMFLVKEALWGHSLEINETDRVLLEEVKALVEKFKKDGVDNKKTFLDKTVAYTNSFFRLYQEDLKDRQNLCSSSGNAPSQNGESHSNCGSGSQNADHAQSSQQGSGQSSEQNGSSQQNSGHQGNASQGNVPTKGIKAKDASGSAGAFVFDNPDKIKEAINTLASELQVDQFIGTLEASGLSGLTSKEQERLWFTVRSAEIIPIEENTNNGSADSYMYPATWKIGEPIENMDMMLTLMTFPRIIPGITTKKWQKNSNSSVGLKKKQRDLLLVLDTSGSMGDANNTQSSMHQAILSSFGLIAFFESKSSSVATLCFSDRITTECRWTTDYDSIRDQILLSGNGGTKFPIGRIKALLEDRETNVVTVVVTDGDLGNSRESEAFFRSYLSDDNKLYLFILGKNRQRINLNYLESIGAHVYQAETAEEFCNAVVSDLT